AQHAEALGKKDAFTGVCSRINEKNALLQDACEASAPKTVQRMPRLQKQLVTTLMNTNNVYYRFCHSMHNEFYDKAQPAFA
ncbi:MAG TPA: alkylhydroperoxidase, partial [Flavisolibacter sp.]|nr:alkylhydroperoxidase [Flavisolibacter sp.]